MLNSTFKLLHELFKFLQLAFVHIFILHLLQFLFSSCLHYLYSSPLSRHLAHFNFEMYLLSAIVVGLSGSSWLSNSNHGKSSKDWVCSTSFVDVVVTTVQCASIFILLVACSLTRTHCLL